MKENYITIGVIVPAYNCEKYIDACIKSIISQTYRKLQIIIIDDGSTDETSKIVDKYIEMDDRIQVIHQRNRGVSEARYRGILECNADYITFVDADDTVDNDMYENLISYVEEYDLDIVHCGYTKHYLDKSSKQFHNTKNVIIQNCEEALACLIGGKLFVGSLCNKLYRRDLFNNIYIDKTIKINEDILLNYLLFKQVKKSLYIDIPKYNYWEREQSSTKRIDKVRINLDCVKVAKYIYDDCDNEKLKELSRFRLIVSLTELLKSYIYSNDNSYKEESKRIVLELKSLCKECTLLNRKIKIKIKLICNYPYIFKLVYYIYDKLRKPNWDI